MYMKTELKNKETNITVGTEENPIPVTYFGLLSNIIGTRAVDTAWSVSELKTRLSIVEALQSDADVVELTDVQKELIKSEVAESKWTVVHKDIVEFIEYIETL